VERTRGVSTRAPTASVVASRTQVATFAEYSAAEQAVDSLVVRGFPVGALCVTGHDLRLVEDVTGRLTYLAAVGRGALVGAPFGILVAVLFSALELVDPLVSVVRLAAWGAAAGAAAGAVVASVARWLEEGRRDFTSTRRVEAARYELLCASEHADEAKRILGPVI
jgi:hypothetical protein